MCKCLVQQKILLVTKVSAINRVPHIPQSTVPPCPVYQTLLFDFGGSGSETKISVRVQLMRPYIYIVLAKVQVK